MKELKKQSYMDELTDYHFFVNPSLVNNPISDYYVNYFFNEATNGEKILWNWWSFLFGPFWFFTRKMYAPALLFIFINYIFLIVSNTIYSSSSSLLPTFLAGMVKYAILTIPLLIMGYTANPFYYSKFINLEKTAPESREERNQYFAKKGGVSNINFGISILLIIGIIIQTFYRNII